MSKTAFNKLFYSGANPLDLGVSRFFFYLLAILVTWNYDFRSYGEVARELWYPVGFYDLFHLPLFSAQTLFYLSILWRVLLFLSAIGFATKIVTSSSAVIGVYLLGLDWALGLPHHKAAFLTICFFILAFSPCGEIFSVDNLLRKNRRDGLVTPERYIWPIRLIQLCWCLVFFNAGLSKLRTSGFDFVVMNMEHYLILSRHLWVDWTMPLQWELNRWLSQQKSLIPIVAAFSLSLELLAPLAFFWHKSRKYIIPAVASMQIGIFLFQFIFFVQILPTYVFWVPWSQWIKTGRRDS